MRLVRASILAALTLVASTAQADIILSGWKSVKLSIRVDGELPAGKVMVLAKSFQGADVIAVGQVQPFTWHQMLGDMSLVLVDAAEVPKIEAARKVLARDVLAKIVARGIPCSEPFEGLRVVRYESPAREVRWTWAFTVEGTSCKATLVRKEHLDKNERVVEVSPDASASGSAAASASATPPVPSASAAPIDPSAAAPPAKTGCGACEIGAAASGPNGTSLVLAALGVAIRRARRGDRSRPRTARAVGTRPRLRVARPTRPGDRERA